MSTNTNITADMFRAINTCTDGVDVFVETFGEAGADYRVVLEKARQLDTIRYTLPKFSHIDFFSTTERLIVEFLDVEYTPETPLHIAVEPVIIQVTISLTYLKETLDPDTNLAVTTTITREVLEADAENGAEATYFVHNSATGTYTPCGTAQEAVALSVTLMAGSDPQILT